MKSTIFRIAVTALTCVFAVAGHAAASGKTAAENKGCQSCHDGIEQITDGGMMAAIAAMGSAHDDPAGCVVCHGGNPTATTKEAAHTGAPQGLAKSGGPDNFYPDPGSIWIADKSCGQCHAGYAENVKKSLMNTEAGKLQGNLWSWGLQKERGSKLGNYTTVDADGPIPALGSPEYKAYMKKYIAAHPEQIPAELKQVPEVDIDKIAEHPNLAAITYSRQQCQRCHVGVNGREKRGDFRGAGCSSCHIPYSNNGFYEGNDPTIAKDQPGHMLVHTMQSSREHRVHINGKSYSGIPTETCATCHNRGKRIGVSYQGLMEFPYGSPYDEKGGKQSKLHTKKYVFIADDLHHQKASRPGNPEGGLLCQDCHTSVDMHGDGNIPGTTLAQVEVECEDCHGTPEKAPWDLPLGYGEEFQKSIGDKPRGLTKDLPAFMTMGTVYPPQDGYLLTARGNPFGNVVKKGDEVIVHSASGLDFKVPVLKTINDSDSWVNEDAKIAMTSIPGHMEKLECYACHADWAPQCYGCHVTVDYSKGKTDVDWITNGNNVGADGQTTDHPLGTNGLTSPGKVSETRSYLRWETPILGINGEGRVSPLMPGCQVITTVIDKTGKTVAKNVIWNTPEGKGIDHAAVQPHTAGRKARSCESCHNNPKTLGYGIEDGRFMHGYDKGLVVDLQTATLDVIPKQFTKQIQAVPKLDHDLSQIVTRDGKQLVSVGSHWELTGPLPQEMRDKMERSGLCKGCHKNMSNKALWSKVDSKPQGWITNKEHQDLMDKFIKDAAKAASK